MKNRKEWNLKIVGPGRTYLGKGPRESKVKWDQRGQGQGLFCACYRTAFSPIALSLPSHMQLFCNFLKIWVTNDE